MQIEKILDTLEKWFRITGGCGLILPDGWFGRPHDNIHQLTFVKIRQGKIIIELDNTLHLIVTEPKVAENRNNEFILGKFLQCVFDWREYDTGIPHCSYYTSGDIKFVAPIGFEE